MQRLKISIVCVVGICLFVSVLFSFFGQEKGFRLSILDVGQGSSALIQTPDNLEILIDAGESNRTLRSLGEVRVFWDRYIDMMIGTHADRDHIGMFPEVIRRFSPSLYIDSGKTIQNPIVEHIIKSLNAQDIQHAHVFAGERIEVGENTVMTILHPHEIEVHSLSENDASLVIRVEHGEYSFLLMGDVSKEIEELLITRYGDYLKSDVLVVGHHGSKTSTSYDFLSVVDPAYAVISVGADNRYGHPHDSVMSNLYHQGVSVLRTDTHGTIQFRITDQKFDIMVK